MARSQLQRIAQGLAALTSDAEEAADSAAASSRALSSIRTTLQGREFATGLTAAGAANERIARRMITALDEAQAASVRARTALVDVHAEGASWVAQLVRSSANDHRLDKADTRRIEKWYVESGARGEARAAAREQVIDAIFSPQASGALLIASAVVPPLVPVAAIHGAIGVGKILVDTPAALARANSAVGREQKVEHLKDAVSEAIEQYIELISGLPVDGAAGVTMDVVESAVEAAKRWSNEHESKGPRT